jgi:hypothetical protein
MENSKKARIHKIDLIIALAIDRQGAVNMNTAHREWIRTDAPDLPDDEYDYEEDVWENLSVLY